MASCKMSTFVFFIIIGMTIQLSTLGVEGGRLGGRRGLTGFGAGVGVMLKLAAVMTAMGAA